MSFCRSAPDRSIRSWLKECEANGDDDDGICVVEDFCPDDPNKIDPGVCGCGEADTDTDGDGVADCIDICPSLPNVSPTDADGDGFTDGAEVTIFGTDPCNSADQPTCSGINTIDTCIDGDGITTPGRGAFSAVWGTPLTTWPASGATPEGIDWFDTDSSGSWTFGDDIHLERTTSCPTGTSNGFHVAGADCVLLDLDSSLFTGQGVDCDLENTAFCTPAHFADLATVGIKFTDGEVAADGVYNNLEDIIQDNNGNGIFD